MTLGREVAMGAPIVHFEVNGKDFKRTKDFYCNLFQWNITEVPPGPYGLVNTGVKMGINGGLGQLDADKTPFVTIYVQVENPQAYLDKAVSMGAKVIVPVTVAPDMVTFAQFTDPDGLIVGLVKGPQFPPKEKPKTKRAAPKRKKARAVRGRGKRKRSK
jgi:predicted enzyme related to lactoylglutathione lyase